MFKNSVLCFATFILVLVSCNTSENKPPQKNSPMKNLFHDPHSFAIPSEAVITHLSWDAVVDFENKSIEGVARYTIDNKSGTDRILFDTRDLIIHKVTRGKEEKETSFELGEEKEFLGQALRVSITPETQYVNIYYKSKPEAAAVQWLTPQQTADKKHPYLFTQSQAILARTWIPIQDSPGIRFTYDAHVKVPSEMLSLMSASNPQEKNESGEYDYEMNQPIPAYLMALVIGDVVFRPIDERTGVYAEKSIIDAAHWEFEDMDEMLHAAEELYGPYRWDRYDVIVLPPSFPFGGMENPRLTFATPTILAGDRSLTSLIAHEMAHSWSGNLVTNATWNDFWLNEGFTTYFEKRIMEKVYGADYAKMLWALSYQDLQTDLKDLKEEGLWNDTKLKLDLEGRNPDDGMTNIAYDKGSLFLLHIERITGRETFDNFLKNYFSDNAFKSMTTEAFLEYLNEHLIKGDSMLARRINADAWIYQPGLPEDHPVVKTDRFEKVEESIKAWLGGTPAQDLPTDKWTTHEWLHFLRKMPEDLSKAQMSELDEAFHFTDSGNSEILAEWFQLAIEHQYEAAYPRLKAFLIQVGRRKFLKPLYEELAKTPEGLKMAREIYKDARPNYHSVSYETIDEILDWKPSEGQNN